MGINKIGQTNYPFVSNSAFSASPNEITENDGSAINDSSLSVFSKDSQQYHRQLKV